MIGANSVRLSAAKPALAAMAVGAGGEGEEAA